MDLDWQVTFFNQAAEEITGLPAAEALGRPCCEVFRANVCESACVLRHTMETGKPVINRAIAILRADDKEIPISISTALLKDESGKIIGGVETFRDLSLVEELRREIHRQYRLEDILSKSPLMLKSLRCCRKSPAPTAPCSSRGKAAPARNWWPEPCIT